MHCTQCGDSAEGRFCGACGASLIEIDCPSCDAPAPPGRRFCVECGSPLRKSGGGRVPAAPGAAGGGRGPSGADLGWWISGGLLVVLLVVGGWALTADTGSSGSGPPQQQGQPGQLGPAPNIDLSSMTPREAADRLYDRVMQALSQQDTTEIMNFLPMAIDAYELARPLDLDGLFHLSLLQRAGLRYEEALETAQEGLAQDPDHLLNLSAAAEAARETGQDDLAAEYYTHLLEVWEEERARDDRVEYEEHAPLIPTLRTDAERFLEERGR